MKIGESFFVPRDDREYYSVRSSASYFAARNPGYKFSIHRIDNPDGCRVWRVKAPEIVYGGKGV